jgi:hypothetical protein
VETINKLGANVRCLEQAEGKLCLPQGVRQANGQNTMLDSNRKSKTIAYMHTCLIPYDVWKGCLEMKGRRS